MLHENLRNYLNKQQWKYAENGFIPVFGKMPTSKFYYRMADQVDFPGLNYLIAKEVARSLSAELFTIVAEGPCGIIYETYIFMN